MLGGEWKRFRRRPTTVLARESEGEDIHTLEGVMHANPGDMVVRGIQGEEYPVKREIFDQIYEGE